MLETLATIACVYDSGSVRRAARSSLQSIIEEPRSNDDAEVFDEKFISIAARCIGLLVYF